jgi:hypothetical protein
MLGPFRKARVSKNSLNRRVRSQRGLIVRALPPPRRPPGARLIPSKIASGSSSRGPKIRQNVRRGRDPQSNGQYGQTGREQCEGADPDCEVSKRRPFIVQFVSRS